MIREAFERGVTFFDTAEGYGPFTNELLVGEAIEPIRDQLIVATKFGFKLDENGAMVGLDSRPEHIQGFLTGQITPDTKFDDPGDLRSSFPRFTPEALKANFAVVDFLRDLAARKGSTPAQIALAWLLAQKPWIVPIPGATKLAHLDDNLPASDLELTPDDLREIDAAFAAIDVKGAPLSEGLTAMADR